MKLAISGATGYIGRQFVLKAHAGGHQIVSLTRRPPQFEVAHWIPFELNSDVAVTLPAGTDAVIHLAATTNSTDFDVKAELQALRRLLAASVEAHSRFIFVSSQTASERAPTAYGRAKWLAEQEVLAAGGVVMRPGQVYGGPESALFGLLVSSVRSLPVIPAFYPAPLIQPVHVDDLALALLRAAEDHPVRLPILCVGALEPLPFTDFLRAIATQRLGRIGWLVPVPVVVIRLLARALGAKLSARLGLSRLQSLIELPLMDCKTSIEVLGLQLRPLVSGMSRSGCGRRRALLREGRAIMAYVLGETPSFMLLRRYARSIECLRSGTALQLPPVLLNCPTIIASIDCSALDGTSTGREFMWRLNAAVVLAEASTQGAQRYIRQGKPAGLIVDAFRIAKAVAAELVWRILGPAVRAILKPSLFRDGAEQ